MDPAATQASDPSNPGTAGPDPLVADPMRSPAGSDNRFADPGGGPNAYAVPLTTLLAGAFVATSDQVLQHPEASTPVRGGGETGGTVGGPLEGE